MWSFVEVVRIELTWGRWEALVTLQRDGVPESFWCGFDSEPTMQQAADAGVALAARMNNPPELP